MSPSDASPSDFLGRRLPDTDHHLLPAGWSAGDYWKRTAHGEPIVVDYEPTNLTHQHWMVCTPNGLLANLIAHTVREHEDGTISVLPGDGSSNSILVEQGTTGKSWHGYIYAGVWREC